MDRTTREMIMAGAGLAALAVVTGALGAHSMRSVLTGAQLAVYQKAVDYHAYHALGLFAVAFVSNLMPGMPLVRLAGRFMIAGIVLFSGSLYALSMTGIGWLGAITPLGGLAFITAWMMLVFAVAKFGKDARSP